MRSAAGVFTFLLTSLFWAGLAFAQKNPGGAGGAGISTPEPSMLLYAASALVPAWFVFRRK